MRPYDERLEHLLARAAKVFAEKGYHSTTMRDLAAASGISLAGMYYYVRGKEELLALVQERCFARVLAGAEQAVAAASDPVERLQGFIRHHVTFFAANLAEMKVLSHEANSLRGERQRKVNAIKRRYVDLLERLLREVAPEEPRAERSAAAYELFGMMNWIYNWYDPAGEIDPDRLAGLIARIFVGGFAEARSTVQGGCRIMPTLTEPKAEKKTLVHYLVEGGVAIIELDDPPANTYTYDMMHQLDEAILQARFDDTAHVIVLRGHGEKFFSAGANIAYLNSITPRYKYFFCLHANE